jgi:hypothetical protein
MLSEAGLVSSVLPVARLSQIFLQAAFDAGSHDLAGMICLNFDGFLHALVCLFVDQTPGLTAGSGEQAALLFSRFMETTLLSTLDPGRRDRGQSTGLAVGGFIRV